MVGLGVVLLVDLLVWWLLVGGYFCFEFGFMVCCVCCLGVRLKLGLCSDLDFWVLCFLVEF